MPTYEYSCPVCNTIENRVLKIKYCSKKQHCASCGAVLRKCILSAPSLTSASTKIIDKFKKYKETKLQRQKEAKEIQNQEKVYDLIHIEGHPDDKEAFGVINNVTLSNPCGGGLYVKNHTILGQNLHCTNNYAYGVKAIDAYLDIDNIKID